MENFDLLINRIICLYLNAKDKIKIISLASKSWRKLVYSGYAWESLFDDVYDKSWKSSGFNNRIFKTFEHFKGVHQLVLTPQLFS